MFSPSLFTKQQMELLFDHSTKSLTEILRKQRHTKQHSDTCELTSPRRPPFRRATGRSSSCCPSSRSASLLKPPPGYCVVPLCPSRLPPQSVAACLYFVAGRILSRMGSKSRETIYGASVRAAAERATQARKQADRLAVEAWNKRMLGFQGPAQPCSARPPVFCPTCGGRIFWYPEIYPGKVSVPVGCFDDLEFPRPISAGWCRGKFGWVNFASDIPQTQQQTS
jgi:hypothetical protein